MSTDGIDQLYSNYALLAEAGPNIGTHSATYEEIINAAKGSTKERILAGQFIPKFYKYFKELASRALEAQFDLCEDPLLNIRKQAIKELPTFAQNSKGVAKKIAAILGQLLISEEPSESIVVHNALTRLLHIDPNETICGVFNVIKNGEDKVRDKCSIFISTNIKLLPQELVASFEVTLIGEILSTLQDAGPDEIPLFLELLLYTSMGKELTGKLRFIDAIADLIEKDKPFRPNDEYIVDRLISFLNYVKPMIIKAEGKLSASKYLTYFSEEVLPSLTTADNNSSEGKIIVLLQMFSELISYNTDASNWEQKVSSIYNTLVHYLPVPQQLDTEDLTDLDMKYEFSQLECLLYCFHKTQAFHSGLLADAEELKDFRQRLQFFARTLQGYIRTLQKMLKDVEDVEKGENKIRGVALKTTYNINLLIKDFFRTPPSNKTEVELSWIKPLDVRSLKRLRGDADSQEGVVRKKIVRPNNKNECLPLYTPPTGKYSQKLGGLGI